MEFRILSTVISGWSSKTPVMPLHVINPLHSLTYHYVNINTALKLSTPQHLVISGPFLEKKCTATEMSIYIMVSQPDRTPSDCWYKEGESKDLTTLPMFLSYNLR